MDVKRCPRCGWPTVEGGSCERYSPGPASCAPAKPTASSAAGIEMVVLLLLIGSFWIFVAALWIRAALCGGPGGRELLIGIVGLLDLLLGGYVFAAVSAVLRPHYHAPGQLVLISVAGVGWALVGTYWLGVWFQPIIVPLHVALGVLAWISSAYFDAVGKSPWIRPFVRARDRGIGPASPVRLPPSTPPPPWERPSISRCLRRRSTAHGRFSPGARLPIPEGRADGRVVQQHKEWDVKAARYLFLVAVLALSLGSSACSNKDAASIPTTGTSTGTTSPATATVTPTDYSDPVHWLAVPSSPDKQVDVFYIYPTAYSKDASTDPDFCTVDNPQMMKAAQTAFQRQATAFAPSANLYAPYYRQVDAMYQLALPAAQQEQNIRHEPLVDVTAAFEYYLQNYNHGRPFILAAHSQGSAVLRDLLSDYMKAHPDVYKRMIAAYVVGQSITTEYLADNPHLKYATGPDDTGVIVSWNTEAPTIGGTNPVTMPGGIAINPITWTTEEATATATQNLGSIELDPTTGTPVLDQNGQIERVTGLADARVDKTKGVVICSTVDPAKYASGFPEGVYHTFDYPFYFFDVRANAAVRIQQYFSLNTGN